MHVHQNVSHMVLFLVFGVVMILDTLVYTDTGMSLHTIFAKVEVAHNIGTKSLYYFVTCQNRFITN